MEEVQEEMLALPVEWTGGAFRSQRRSVYELQFFLSVGSHERITTASDSWEVVV
jgi:hypothetical protein